MLNRSVNEELNKKRQDYIDDRSCTDCENEKKFDFYLNKLISQELKNPKNLDVSLINDKTNRALTTCCCTSENCCKGQKLGQQKQIFSNEANTQERKQLKSCLVKKSAVESNKLNTSYCKECELEKKFEIYLNRLISEELAYRAVGTNQINVEKTIKEKRDIHEIKSNPKLEPRREIPNQMRNELKEFVREKQVLDKKENSNQPYTYDKMTGQSNISAKINVNQVNKDKSLKNANVKHIEQTYLVSSKVNSIHNQNTIEKSQIETQHLILKGEQNLRSLNEENKQTENDTKKIVSFNKDRLLEINQIQTHNGNNDKNPIKTENKESNNSALVTFVTLDSNKETQTKNLALDEFSSRIIEESFNEITSVMIDPNSFEKAEERDLHEKETKNHSKFEVSMQSVNNETKKINKLSENNFSKETQTENISSMILKDVKKASLYSSDLVRSSLTLFKEENEKKNSKTIKIVKESINKKLPKIKNKRVLEIRPFSSSFVRRKHDCLTKIESVNEANSSSKKNNFRNDKAKKQNHERTENFEIYTRRSQIDYLIDYSNRILIQEKNPKKVTPREFLCGFSQNFTREF